MNNTDEFWEIDGVSLHQYGWSVTTFGGSRYDLPTRRGDNVQLAYRPGQIHRPKQPDQRVITLTMFLAGLVPGTGEFSGDNRQQFNDSWNFLRRLVWKPTNNNLLTLTRRWSLTLPAITPPSGSPSYGYPTPGPQIVKASALAEMSGTMTPTMTGRTRADFQYDFTLADPYFYGDQVVATVVSGSSASVYNAGDDIVSYNNLEVKLIGPLKNPILRNITPEPDVWLKYTGTITGSVTLDIGQFTSVAGDGDVQIGKVTHAGARSWMGLLPGTNRMTLVDDLGTTGKAVITYKPAYV